MAERRENKQARGGFRPNGVRVSTTARLGDAWGLVLEGEVSAGEEAAGTLVPIEHAPCPKKADLGQGSAVKRLVRVSPASA
jgi:hypothetical protein